jgi:cyclophilin family peptidyl-prolyl cis-trans isomerase
MKYTILARVDGRATADAIEVFLKADGIDAVLFQEAISHLTHPTTFAPVEIFVPKSKLLQAQVMLKSFYQVQDHAKEKDGMANKKKIEERLRAQQAERTEKIIRWGGAGIVFLVLIGVIWLLTPGRSSNVVELPTDIPTVAQVPLDVPEAAVEQYNAYPPMTIDTEKKYFAKFVMANGGEFTIELYPDKAPLTVNSFVFLARDGYFDGVTFHRVLEGFMAQGGDPTGTGSGGPGYQFVNEDSDLTFDKPGVLAMANAGRDTNGSQFFITFDATPQLNGDYTIFGQVIEGMDVVNGIARRDPLQSPNYVGDAIETVTIMEE